jgi:serine/threonine-protein kinase
MLDRAVALKVLDPSYAANADVLQRFVVEARAAARVRHPGVVQVHDLGHAETVFGTAAYIAMEVLDGESVTQRLERCGSMPAPTVIELGRQIASAVAAAHRAKVLHRDLKPDNLFLVEDPAVPTGERIKVLDFGLAKIDGGLTHGKIVFGTPHYMSPEQCKSTGDVDHRSDIYALGCVLFELLCGRPPFDGSYHEVMKQHVEEMPRRASTLSPHWVPPALDRLIATMLDKDPNRRPQNMLAVQHALYDADNQDPSSSSTAISIPIPTNGLGETTLDANVRSLAIPAPAPVPVPVPVPIVRAKTHLVYPTYPRRQLAGMIALILVIAAAVATGVWILHEHSQTTATSK